MTARVLSLYFGPVVLAQSLAKAEKHLVGSVKQGNGFGLAGRHAPVPVAAPELHNLGVEAFDVIHAPEPMPAPVDLARAP